MCMYTHINVYVHTHYLHHYHLCVCSIRPYYSCVCIHRTCAHPTSARYTISTRTCMYVVYMCTSILFMRIYLFTYIVYTPNQRAVHHDSLAPVCTWLICIIYNGIRGSVYIHTNFTCAQSTVTTGIYCIYAYIYVIFNGSYFYITYKLNQCTVHCTTRTCA